jgi:hypothetical protein
MRTREAKHPLHGSAWLQKRGQATIDSQLSEYLQIIQPRSHAKYLLFESQRSVQANMPRFLEGNLHFAMTRWRFCHDPMENTRLLTFIVGFGRWPVTCGIEGSMRDGRSTVDLGDGRRRLYWVALLQGAV